MRSQFILTVWTAVLAAGAVRAEPPLSRFTFHEVHMGTEFRILLYAPTRKRPARRRPRRSRGSLSLMLP